ncbi:MAG: methylenetetrahydrofolate reductase [Planctomycetota bacterium]
MDWLTENPTVLEIVPPPLRLGAGAVEKRLAKVAKVMEAVRLDAVNIPEIREEESKCETGDRKSRFEPRVPPRELAHAIQSQLGVRCVINRVVVHRPALQQADWFRETYEKFGVRDFVLVGGEKSGQRYPGPNVPEANQLIREALPDDISVGNICIPTRCTPERREADRMARKVAQGADFFTTQIIYHAEHLTDLIGDIHAGHEQLANTPLLLSVCPVRAAESFKFLRWLGVKVSVALEQELTKDPDLLLQASVDHVVDMWRSVQRHLRDSNSALPLGLNIAPVGAISIATTIELARRLHEVRVP